MSFPISFLTDELKQNGIAADAPELLRHSGVLAELSYALSPIVHEGKLQPYGFVVVEQTHLSAIKTTCDKLFIHLPEARRVADGCHSFSLFQEGQFQGVFIGQYAAYTELQLVQLQQELNAIICVTGADGVTKLFCDAGIFIHQYRSWQKKPSVTSALQSVQRCAPQADTATLRDLLEFCFHDLSSRKIGATLVWCLAEPSATELDNMNPNFVLQQIESRVGSDRSVAVLRHLLAHTDGAAILDAGARAIGVGAQLKYSDASKHLIEPHAGTRHTSAQRFSYDFAQGIIFVVSSDGPVTVFSDGMSVTDLEVRLADETAIANPEKSATNNAVVFECSNEVICDRCQKQLKVQETDSGDLTKQEKSLSCPVCGNFLYSARCSNLEVYVVKTL